MRASSGSAAPAHAAGGVSATSRATSGVSVMARAAGGVSTTARAAIASPPPSTRRWRPRPAGVTAAAALRAPMGLPPSPPPAPQAPAQGGWARGRAGPPRRVRDPRTCARRWSTSSALTPALERRLDEVEERLSELVARTADESFSSLGHKEMAALQRGISELEPVVEARRRSEAARREVAELDALARNDDEDADVRALAREEAAEVRARLPALERALLTTLIPRDPAEDRDAVIEVRAGTGGEEACLFAAELMEMYRRYAQLRGWRWEELERAEAGGAGAGVRMASAAVSAPKGGSSGGWDAWDASPSGGEGPGDRASAPTPPPASVYGSLRFESGVHRVQRVPATENAGRLHTSAASVAVLAAAEEADVELRESDVRIDTYRAGGAGGQHVNTTNSAVRVTHEPTGLVVTIQDERSQHKNREKAFKVLRARLFEMRRAEAHAKEAKDRRAQVGSGDRSERVRTYNFPQGRVTDHRISKTEHTLEQVLNGTGLDDFVRALRVHYQSEQLAELGREVAK